jgi:hypothetical protein
MRITTVAKSRKPAGTCGSCGDELGVGSSYRWIKSRFGPRQVRCMKPECAFKPWETITNEKTSALVMAQCTVGDSIASAESLDDIKSALSDFADAVREVKDMYEESAENIRSGFDHDTYQSEEFDSNAQELDAFADDCESWDSGEDEPTEDDDDSWDHDAYESFDEAHDAWLDSVRDEANDQANEMPTF